MNVVCVDNCISIMFVFMHLHTNLNVPKYHNMATGEKNLAPHISFMFPLLVRLMGADATYSPWFVYWTNLLVVCIC